MLAPRRPRSCCAPRRQTPSVERLEDRSLLSGLPFQYVVDDPGHLFDPYPLLRTDLQAAGQILSGLIDGKGTIQVVVRPNNSIPRSDGSTIGVVYVTTVGGTAVYQSSAEAEALTGVDPNGTGPEIEMDFNTQTFLPHVWFDPSGAARTGTVPANQTDFISLVLHETLHGLGFAGYRAISGAGYGALPADHESNYDALTSFGSGANAGTLYFRGALASAAYGGPVPLTSVGPNAPLTSQNFYHLGNPAGSPGADLLPDLMNGMQFTQGTRYTVRPLDLAILADLGYAIPGLSPTPAPPSPTPTALPFTLVVPSRASHRKKRHPPAHPRHQAPVVRPAARSEHASPRLP